jgi:hypothetical protein
MEYNQTVKQLAQLAMESDTVDPIDWGMLNIKEQDAFLMMASNVLQQIESIPEEQRAVVAMATMTKLLVENFVLNLRLKGAENVKRQI